MHPHAAKLDFPGSDLPFTQPARAAEILGCSVSKLYAEANRGRLEFVRIAGRTQIVTASLLNYVRERTETWTPSGRSKNAVAARVARARADWRAE